MLYKHLKLMLGTHHVCDVHKRNDIAQASFELFDDGLQLNLTQFPGFGPEAQGIAEHIFGSVL